MSSTKDNYNHLLELTINNQDYEKAYGYADWLQSHTNLPEDILKFGTAKGAAKYMQGNFSDALDIFDSVIATGAPHKARPEASAEFFEEYAEILDGAGQSHRAISIVDSVYQSMLHPDNGHDRILRIGATAQFYANTGNTAKAKALLDSINHDNTQNIFEIYTYIAILRAGIQYKETGRFPTNMMHRVTKNIDRNFQLAQFDRQTALESIIELNDDNYELKLQRQRLWLLIAGISIVLIISGICVYFVLNRRKQRLIETEERAETLELMLKDMEKAESGQADTSNGDKLKAALLRQLGIFKTFASTPTQQSRDALKKISTVGNDGESIESLVDWKDFYSMIDNLYDGFHSKLCKKYPGTFNDKEQQIIVLLKAGFSTKEIGVLSEQSSATIYTRKSVIRKKLGTSENKDFIAQLEEDFKAD